MNICMTSKAKGNVHSEQYCSFEEKAGDGEMGAEARPPGSDFPPGYGQPSGPPAGSSGPHSAHGGNKDSGAPPVALKAEGVHTFQTVIFNLFHFVAHTD